MTTLVANLQPMRSAENQIPQTFPQRATTTPPIAAIALNRIAFGPTPSAWAAFEALGADDASRLQAYIDEQLNPDAIDDSDCDARITAANLETTNKTRQELWVEYHRDAMNMTRSSQPYDDMVRIKFMRAVYSKRQLLEVMSDFWHDHFNVQASASPIRSMILNYDRECIRPNALGNFRVMLEAVAKSASMLYYLDNYTSSVAGPNENYARELLELHTLGAENYLGSGIQTFDVPKDADGYPVGYVDGDVYEASRCFTGWTVGNGDSDAVGNTGLFMADEGSHDRNLKFLLGAFINPDQDALTDGGIVLDRLAENPGTARHVCRKLCKRLISDTPSDAIVASSAAVFHAQRDAADQLAQVVRHILESAEFQTTWGSKVKRPFELAVSAMRAINFEFPFNYTGSYDDTRRFIDYYNAMGQRLFYWPAPNGYPDAAGYWLNTTSMFKRFRLLNWLTSDKSPEDEFYTDLVGQTGIGHSATALVDYWIDRIFGYPISAEERDELVEFMAQGYNPAYELPVDTNTETQDRLRALVALIMMMPSFQQR